MKQKIIIVDDHTLVSNTIADLIESFETFTVTHQFRNGKELFESLEIVNNKPDLILLDINMPIMNGFETMEKLQILFPTIKVLALSMNDDEMSIIKMMRLGACGYISKIVKEEELIHALNLVIEKGYYYTDQVSRLLMDNFQAKNKPSVMQFTEKEKILLSYVCTEMTYKEIADKMCLSPKTIDGYREDLFRKTDAKSRIGLAMFAIKEGYFTP